MGNLKSPPWKTRSRRYAPPPKKPPVRATQSRKNPYWRDFLNSLEPILARSAEAPPPVPVKAGTRPVRKTLCIYFWDFPRRDFLEMEKGFFCRVRCRFSDLCLDKEAMPARLFTHRVIWIIYNCVSVFLKYFCKLVFLPVWKESFKLFAVNLIVLHFFTNAVFERDKADSSLYCNALYSCKCLTHTVFRYMQ